MKVRRVFHYIPRKFLHVLLYLFFLICLLIFYTMIVLPLQSQNDSIRDYVNNDGVDPFVEYRSLLKRDYSDQFTYDAEQRKVGPGEQGTAFKLLDANESLTKLRDDLYRQNGYDAYVSDQIALNRSVKDIRHKECRNMKYIEKLPSVSVIFPFHNEHFSALLRSVYSIINRSPPGVVQEIILVDDASTKEALKSPLDDYIKAHNLGNVVKVVRTSKREGLIRARLVGAKAATSEILVFLDAHSEANYNWLPPLVEPIALNYKTVVCPFVDVIDCDTFEYRPQDEGARGSFDWEFNYKRLPLTDDDVQHPTRPFNNPVMAGGYFAISTKWFWELGGYDEGLDIWGGEQYELSFKTWQCHGRLVDAPCSRVGHIYRCKYVPFPNPGIGDFISRNYKRVAEVWMDDYKKYLYEKRPEMIKADPGNLEKQFNVRDRLKCKSFDWFIQEVAFDQIDFYPPVEPLDGAKGKLKNVQANKCVETLSKESGDKFKVSECNELGEQEFHLGFQEDIRPIGRKICFDVSTSNFKAPVSLFACHGMRGNQWFQYRVATKQLYHHVSNMCMDCDLENGDVYMSPCDKSSASQQWEWTQVNEDALKEMEEKRLKKEAAKRRNSLSI